MKARFCVGSSFSIHREQLAPDDPQVGGAESTGHIHPDVPTISILGIQVSAVTEAAHLTCGNNSKRHLGVWG